MEITELPPTPLVLPAGGELVHIRTQEWAVEPVGGRRPAWPGSALGPEAQVLREREPLMCGAGDRASPAGRRWDGVRVNAFRGELRTQWFRAPAALPARRGRRARVGRGDFRLPACRERRDAERFLRRVRLARARPAAFFEAKVGPDRIKPTQLRFVEIAPRFRQPGRLHDRPGMPGCRAGWAGSGRCAWSGSRAPVATAPAWPAACQRLASGSSRWTARTGRTGAVRGSPIRWTRSAPPGPPSPAGLAAPRRDATARSRRSGR